MYEQGVRSGKGLYFNMDEEDFLVSFSKGTWSENMLEGEGLIYDKNGLVELSGKFDDIQLAFCHKNHPKHRYYGDLKDNKEHGWGQQVFPLYKYYGEFDNGQRHGIGKTVENGIAAYWEYERGELRRSAEKY